MTVFTESKEAALTFPPIPGVVKGAIRGREGLLHELERGAFALPSHLYGVPVVVDVNPAAAPNLLYSLWACWLPAQSNLEPRLQPMAQWLSALPSARKQSPLLVLARAQGQWDFQSEFSPQLETLLHEMDPLLMPSGRALLHADLAGVAIRDTLSKAVRWFLSSLDPASEEPMPVATMLLRSGRRRFESRWGLDAEAVFSARCAPGETQRRERIALPPGLNAAAELRGAFVWGAWRGADEAERFLALGVRAEKAVRGSVHVDGALSLQEQEIFATKVRAAYPPLAAGSASGEAYASSLPQRLLKRAAKAIEVELNAACRPDGQAWEPYRLLTGCCGGALLSLAGAASPLTSTDPRDPGSPGGEDAEAAERGVWEAPLFPPLRERREIQLAFSLEAPVTATGAQAATKLRRKVPPACAGRRLGTEAMLEKAFRLLQPCDDRSARGAQLSASLSVARTTPLGEALFASALGVRRDPFSRDLERAFPGARKYNLTVAASLRAGGAVWWFRAANAYRRAANRVAASLAVQRRLRAWLPLLCRESSDDFRRRADAMAMLVYETSTPRAPSDTREMTEDPRDDKVLTETVRSTRKRLLRIAPEWNRVRKLAKVKPWADSHADFRAWVLNAVETRPGHLRDILVVESQLCNAVARLLHKLGQVARGGNYPRYRQELYLRRMARKITAQTHAAASRLLPHDRAEVLAPILLLVGMEAALLAAGASAKLASIDWHYTVTGLSEDDRPLGPPLTVIPGKGIEAPASEGDASLCPDAQRAALDDSGRMNAA